MSNSYFRFKQFVVQQDKSAMKVCTDSCILGAWTARRISTANHILDIGSGTGLLSLMLAQKTNGLIDAVEYDPDAAAQARGNISESPWSSQITLIEGDVRSLSWEKPYDFIISNPPFFESDLHSPEENKNKARHETSLTLNELLTVIVSCLDSAGSFSILVPFHRKDYLEALAEAKGFYLKEQWNIKQTPGHNPFRNISLFSHQKSYCVLTGELIIRDESGKYTDDFMKLMEDYY